MAGVKTGLVAGGVKAVGQAMGVIKCFVAGTPVGLTMESVVQLDAIAFKG